MENIKRALILFISWIIVSSPGFVQAESTNLSCGINIDFETPDDVSLGSNVVWRLTLANNSGTNRLCHVALDADAVLYNGVFIGDIEDTVVTNDVAPSGTNVTTLTLSPADYTVCSQTTDVYEVTAFVRVLGPDEIWVSADHVTLLPQTDYLSLSPSGQVVVGNSVIATVNYRHPLDIDLKGVEVNLSADRYLNTNGTTLEHNFQLGTVTNGQWINVSTNFDASSVGAGTIWGTIVASNFFGTGMSKDISVVE